MKIKSFLLTLLLISSTVNAQQYNNLWIPDTLSGPNFSLTVQDTFKQMIPGNQTITEAINGNWWGPTMIWNKGEDINITVNNRLQDTTTIHWHGIHLPAVMDGGPHQLIPPGTIWQPYWEVKNNAGLYWYHPHLHMMAQEQLNAGLGGLIIIRDQTESALPLPRTYGVDDLPLVLTDRRFNTSNQIQDVPYGDSMMVNGVIRPQQNVPAQVVRLRILNAAPERSYNLGFSDNRTFYVITSDGGLLDNPVGVTRYLLSAAERIEILVNFTGQQGQSFDLKAFNSTLPQNVPGGDVFPPGNPFYNGLARIDFNILHLNVTAQTGSPITSIPSTLTVNNYYNEASSNLTRNLTLTDTVIQGNAGVSFLINHRLFDIDYINYNVPLNNTEIWNISSTSGFGHPFHIHDVQFNILTRNGVAPPAYERGWKDVVFIRSGETIRFITKFDDYSDSLHPFMYHCHIALHEDEGMMGQFVVTDNGMVGINEESETIPEFSIFPNPAVNKINLTFPNQNALDASNDIYYIRIFNSLGKTIYMLPKPQIQNGIDVSNLPAGIYFLQLTDQKSKKINTVKFIKQ